MSCYPTALQPVKIYVRDELGPVERAHVEVNGREVGLTDSEGLLTLPSQALGQKKQLTVRVNSDDLNDVRLGEEKKISLQQARENGIHIQLRNLKLKPDAEYAGEGVAATSKSSKEYTPPQKVKEETLEAPLAPEVQMVHSAPLFPSPAPVSLKPEPSPSPSPAVSEKPSLPVPAVLNVLPNAPVQTKSNSNIEKTVSQKNVVEPAPQPSRQGEIFTVKVSSDSKSLEGASVYLGKMTSKNTMYLGTTDAEGLMKTQVPVSFSNTVLFVRHSCCVPVAVPVTSGHSKTLNVEIKKGTGFDTFLVSYFYGFPRGIEGAELSDGRRRFDLSNGIGLGIANEVHTPKFFWEYRNAVPSRTEVVNDRSDSPVLEYVGQKLPFSPAIAMAEPAPHDDRKVDALWRKFRRDFHARFVKANDYRPLLSTELAKTADLIQATSERMQQNGWEFTPLGPEIDAILGFDWIPEQGNAWIRMRLIEKNGRVAFEHKANLASTSQLPEVLSGELFAAFEASFPVEGSILGVENGRPILNIGKSRSFGVREGQWFMLYGNESNGGPPIKPLGLAKISKTEENRSILEMQSRFEKDFEIKPGMRAVRAHFAKSPSSRSSEGEMSR